MKRFILIITAIVLSLQSLHASQHEVTIPAPWGQISATLSLPDTETSTAILIVAGSGPTDRNGNSPMGISTYCYAMLSDELTEQGYAVLRYDKRGIGQSPLAPELLSSVLFDDYVDDALLLVDYLRTEGYSEVVIVGHSEGGLIAQVAASRPEARIDGIVLLSSTGYPIDQVLLRQLEAQLMPDHMGLMVASHNILRSLKSGRTIAQERIPDELLSLFHPAVQPFLINQMGYNPQELARTSTLPMLIITGGYDIQVSVDNGEALAAEREDARHITLEHMSHVLKDATSNDRMEQLMSVYSSSQYPLSDGLTDAIVEFLSSLSNL